MIVAANHRSFLDPFVIGTMARRPMYYVAKKELFRQPLHGVDAERARARSRSTAAPAIRHDRDRQGDARARRDRADVRRGHARAAGLARQAPQGRRAAGARDRRAGRAGRRDRHRGDPHVAGGSARTRSASAPGRPLRFPHVPDASPPLAGAVTARIWPCVMLQWEWLGGLPPIRRAAIIGAGGWGTSARGLPGARGLRGRARLPHAGAGRRAVRAAASTSATCPASSCPADRLVRVELELGGHDLVCLAVPARALPTCSPPTASGSRARRPAGALQGAGAAARDAAVGVRGRAARARRGRARRAGARRRRSRTAPRSSSPRRPRLRKQLATRSAPPASTSRRATT